jgi:STAM-binding protein
VPSRSTVSDRPRSFGIFRLTDPPGLGIILECDAHEAFHPHANAPIYTVIFSSVRLFSHRTHTSLQDADRGHVIMKDTSLEIVDLR